MLTSLHDLHADIRANWPNLLTSDAARRLKSQRLFASVHHLVHMLYMKYAVPFLHVKRLMQILLDPYVVHPPSAHEVIALSFAKKC